MEAEAKSRALWFVGLTLGTSWLLAGAYALSGTPLDGWVGLVFAGFYMLIPGLVGLGLARWRDGASPLDALGLRPASSWKTGWWLVAWLLPVFYITATIGISLLIPGVQWDPEVGGMLERISEHLSPEELATAREQLESMPINPIVLMTLQALVAGPTINAIFGLGEEAGWRGYLYTQMRPSGFWRYTLVVGVIWGIWHFPLILMGHNYPDHPVIGVGMMVLFTLALSPLFTLIRDKVHTSLGPAVLHGTNNALAGLPLLLLAGGSDLTIGLTGAAGIVALALFGVAVAGYRRLEARRAR